MEQDIRFCDVDGHRLAYATVGEGPLLVFPSWWVSHLEQDWEGDGYRAFFTELARTHRVVRYDRIGAGLSDRDVGDDTTVDARVRSLAAVLDVFGEEPATLFALSCAGPPSVLYAADHPERVRGLVFFSAYADRGDVSPDLRRSLVDIVRANWGLGSQVLASLFAPRADGQKLVALSRFQRRSASADAAAAFLEADFEVDVRDELARLEVPALVLHRRGDRTVPFARGVELASLLPNARFVPLQGDDHFAWAGDTRETFRALASFLGLPVTESTNGDSPLTPRETEVLRLVSHGLSNREIASSLVVSEHTVHRHVANILRKLSQSSRAGAVAQAARAGLI